MREFVSRPLHAPSGAEGREKAIQSAPKYIPKEEWLARLARGSARSVQVHSPQAKVQELGFRWADFLESAHRDPTILSLVFPNRAHQYGRTVRTYGLFRSLFTGKSGQHISYHAIEKATKKSMSGIYHFLNNNEDILEAFDVTVGRFEAPIEAELTERATDGPYNFSPVMFQDVRAFRKMLGLQSLRGHQFLAALAKHTGRGIAELLESMHRDPRIADMMRNGVAILMHYRAHRARFIRVHGQKLTALEFSKRTGVSPAVLKDYLKSVPDLPALFGVLIIE